MINIQIEKEDIAFFYRKVQEKIACEVWKGRNKPVKINNFLNCWITEEAFKQVLISKKIWFRHRALYFGDAIGAGADFTIRMDILEKSVGIRSTTPLVVHRYNELAYPDDRYRLEPEKIADFTIACCNDNGTVQFLGMIQKETLLSALSQSRRLYSKKNQEYFRIVSLDQFREDLLVGLLNKANKVVEY